MLAIFVLAASLTPSFGGAPFAATLYRQLATANQNENFMVSPFSANTLLALTQFGAKDETADEIRAALNLPPDPQKITAYYHGIQNKLNSSRLQSASKIYVKDTFKVKDDFRQLAMETFGTEVENVDFGRTEAAAKQMNEWVGRKTGGKIRNLISAESLTERSRVVMLNAIYFKGAWTNRFDPYLTLKRNFFRTAEDVLQVDLMHDNGYYKYMESAELQAKFLEIPLQGENASVTVILPNQVGLALLENRIDRVLSVAISDRFEYVSVWLPKFRFETAVDLKQVLANLGVRRAFKDEEADLSGIGGEKGELVVDKMVQKTFVGLNEEGVEAAAASSIQLGVPLSGSFAVNPQTQFLADHPFIFYIKVGDLVVFVGRVVTPIY